MIGEKSKTGKSWRHLEIAYNAFEDTLGKLYPPSIQEEHLHSAVEPCNSELVILLL